MQSYGASYLPSINQNDAGAHHHPPAANKNGGNIKYTKTSSQNSYLPSI